MNKATHKKAGAKSLRFSPLAQQHSLTSPQADLDMFTETTCMNIVACPLLVWLCFGIKERCTWKWWGSGSQQLTQIAGATLGGMSGCGSYPTDDAATVTWSRELNDRNTAWFKDTMILIVMVKRLLACKLFHTHIPVDIDHLFDFSKVLRYHWSIHVPEQHQKTTKTTLSKCHGNPIVYGKLWIIYMKSYRPFCYSYLQMSLLPIWWTGCSSYNTN